MPSRLTPAAAAPEGGPLLLYRDDGPLSRALGGALAAFVRVPPVVLIGAGVVPLVLAVAIGGDDLSRPLAAAVVAWLVLTAGISSGRPHADRLRWMVPPVLRAAEYGALLWLAALAGPAAVPAAFALLAVIAFRHYDLVYRRRLRGVTPAPWVRVAGGGWDGRLLVGFALLALGALPAGFFAAAAVLAVVFVGETIVSWTRAGRAQDAVAVGEDDEEDEAG